MAWNRQTRRKLSQYGIGEQRMREEFEIEFQKHRDHNYRLAWSSAFMAFYEYTGMKKNDLQHIAERTVEIANNALCAEEIIMDLKDKTGFDVAQPPSTYEYDEEPEKPDRVNVVRCQDCVWFEPETAEEGDTYGRCRNDYAPCQNQQVDMVWFCGSGEKKEQ